MSPPFFFVAFARSEQVAALICSDFPPTMIAGGCGGQIYSNLCSVVDYNRSRPMTLLDVEFLLCNRYSCHCSDQPQSADQEVSWKAMLYCVFWAFDEAIAELDTFGEESYKDSTFDYATSLYLLKKK